MNQIKKLQKEIMATVNGKKHNIAKLRAGEFALDGCSFLVFHQFVLERANQKKTLELITTLLSTVRSGRYDFSKIDSEVDLDTFLFLATSVAHIKVPEFEHYIRSSLIDQDPALDSPKQAEMRHIYSMYYSMVESPITYREVLKMVLSGGVPEFLIEDCTEAVLSFCSTKRLGVTCFQELRHAA